MPSHETVGDSVREHAHLLERDSQQSPAESMKRDVDQHVLGIALDIARDRQGSEAVDRRLDDITKGAEEFSRDNDSARQLALRTVAAPYMAEAGCALRDQLDKDGYAKIAQHLPSCTIENKK